MPFFLILKEFDKENETSNKKIYIFLSTLPFNLPPYGLLYEWFTLLLFVNMQEPPCGLPHAQFTFLSLINMQKMSYVILD